jgi:dipeptidyl-peptidase-4
MEGSILKPTDFDATRKYPVWFMTYGGPQAPTVADSWGARTWDNAMAHDGFVIFRADPRSASGKGAVSAWTSYKQLGVGELADIETAIQWISQNPWVDASRIGMSGHSYGGFMTSYALTHSTLFAAGIAGAPVTDWRDYDSCYTERFMLTPAENPDGYDKTSVVKAAGNLHGRLLLLHGLIDDNVHLQNSERLIRGLQRANKQFELMLYPESRHGIGGKHYQSLMREFIIRTLGTPAPTPPTPTSESPPAVRSGP